MKYLKTFNQLLERTIAQNSKELEEFRKSYDASIDFDYVLRSVEAMRVSLADLFPALINVKTIDKCISDKKFLYELNAKSMRIGEVIDSRDSATLLKIPVKFLMIYNIDSIELETPNYLLVQRAKSANIFSQELELYYVQDDITKFFNSLSNLVMTVEHPVTKASHVYKSSNSGEDWSLYRQDTNDSSLKKRLDWQDIDNIKNLNYIITIYFEEK